MRATAAELAGTGVTANAVCPGSDDHLYVTQNGGVVGEWHAEDKRPESIQRVALEGRVEVRANEGLVVEQGQPDLIFREPTQPRTLEFLQRIIEAGRL